MTVDIAEKGLAFAFRSPNPAIKFEFQGGVPLLNFDLIRHIVTRAKEINLVERRDLEFVIATTLSVVTDEMLAFCKEHKVLISTSLDGPEDLHNMNRPRRGRDSYQSFVVGLKKARLTLGYDQVSALMTTTERSLRRVRDIVDEYVKLGFDGIFLRPMSPYGFAIKTKTFHAYDTDRWLEFYKEGLSYIIQLNKSGYRFSEHYAAIILEKMLCAGDAGFVDLMNPSGAGIAAIVFNYDGAVYASDESRMLAEMGDTTFRLGHLQHHSYEEIILSDALLDALESSFTLSVPQCSDCAFEPYCGADPVFHYATQHDLVGRKPESEFCHHNMAIFKHLIHLMRQDHDVKRIFLSWANRC
jgi:His-Xaa-Ser system radical SAM maturase HxsB